MQYRLGFLLLFSSIFNYAQEPIHVLIDSLNLVESPQEKLKLTQEIALLLKDEDWDRAITYLELSESEAKKTDNPDIHLAPIYVTAANMYSFKDVLDVTLDYYQKAYNIYRKDNNIDEASKIENNLAIVYAKMNNKEEALKHFHEVYLFQSKKNDSLRIAQILNNIGTIYLEENLDSSLHYYNKSLKISKKLNNTPLNAYLFTNLGRIYDLKKDSVKAKSYFEKALSTIKNSNKNNVKSFVYQSISEHYLNINENDSAINYANKTLIIHEDNAYNFANLDAFKTLFTAYSNKEDFKNAVVYYKKFNTLRDSLNIEDKAVNIERLKLQQEYKTRLQIRELQEEKQQFKYFLIGLSLVIGILALLILVIKYRNRMTKNKLERELLKTKQQELRHSLDAKNKVLIGKAMTEMHRTDIINGILKDLKHIKLKAVKKETQQAIDFILKRLQRDLNTNIWEEFEVSFEQVHKSFYKNLTKNHPKLTPKARRLCALLFLDLTSKEISQITGQSFKSVENARTRLRKKLDLTNEKINLSTYLNSLSVN
ncbi:tetratricopeptide repeat protein [Xanthomarina sp. F2636L]|uniref:tetratricopeptide repeat protein n=1 Tax=Xanthomarina sp. F2636L TaxID=2996018 RepID=UPI00225E1891|nr:tetratricopeptide repeat protein [Xanthomarina sp. F2636L]MCX7551658.1 tetratricopeptide repeat protein [Xanthomarina sp. F2636L]